MFLEVSKLVIRCIAALTLLKLQESYKTLKSVFCIANTFNFMKNKQPSLTLINQASLTEKEDFQQMWALKSINLLFLL